MPAPLPQAKAEFFRTLSHPLRIQVLELLQDGPKPVRDLMADLEVEPPNLSQQLALLRHSGLVTSARQGSTVVYALTEEEVPELLRCARRILLSVLADRDGSLEQLRQADPIGRTATET